MKRAALFALALAAMGCGAPPPPAAPKNDVPFLRVTKDAIDGRLWLALTATRAAQAGAGALQQLGAEVVAEGDKLGAFVEIPANECMLAIARGSPTVVDVDLFSYQDDGDAVVSDESAEPDAAVLICPPHPKRLYVVARVMSGSGMLAVGVQSVPKAKAEAVAKAVSARGKPGTDSGRLDSWPGLETKLRKHRDALGARWEDLRRMALPVTPRAATRVGVTIDAGRCVDVLVSPGEEVGAVELVAEDESGRIIARARDGGRDRSLVLCSDVAEEVSLAIRPRGSQGLVAVVVARSALGAAPELSRKTRVDRVTETRELAEVIAAYEKSASISGYEAPKLLGKASAQVGSRTTLPVTLPAGCARIDVLAGRPLATLQADLWDASGTRLSEGSGGAAAALFVCGPGGPATLDVEALGRKGPFAALYRSDKAAPQALIDNPVAASRLLERMNEAGHVAAAAAAAGAAVIALDAETQKRMLKKLDKPGCIDVFAAVGEGGAGLDLRLVDTSTGESTLSRARSVVSNQICSAQTDQPIAVELRLTQGKASALVLIRDVRVP